MKNDEILKLKYYVHDYDKNFKKERKDLYKKAVRNYFLEDVGTEFFSDYEQTMDFFSDYPVQSVEAYREAFNACMKIKDEEQRNKAVAQIQASTLKKVKEFFKEMYEFADRYEQDIVEKYKDDIVNDNIDKKYSLEYSVASEKERLEGKENLSDEDRKALSGLKRYEGFAKGVELLGLGDTSAINVDGAVGRFSNFAESIETALADKYSREVKLWHTVCDKDKLKTLREDVREYIRDNKLVSESPNNYLEKITTYRHYMVRGGKLQATDKTLGDKLLEHKEAKRERVSVRGI